MAHPQHQLSPYERARLDKIRRNEERLKSLGLLDAKKRVRAAARKSKKAPSTPTKRRAARKARTVTPSPKRTSRRLKRQPIQYQPLMDDDEDIRLARKKFKDVKKKTRSANLSFKCEVPANLTSAALTAKQRKVIEKKMEEDFLGKFEVSKIMCTRCVT